MVQTPWRRFWFSPAAWHRLTRRAGMRALAAEARTASSACVRSRARRRCVSQLPEETISSIARSYSASADGGVGNCSVALARSVTLFVTLRVMTAGHFCG